MAAAFVEMSRRSLRGEDGGEVDGWGEVRTDADEDGEVVKT